MSVGIVLDDYYNFELMKIIRDETINADPGIIEQLKKENISYKGVNWKARKRLLGNMLVYDKLFINDVDLGFTLSGSYKGDSNIDEIADRVENSSLLKELKDVEIIENYPKNIQHNKRDSTEVWFPYELRPTGDQLLSGLKTLKEFKGLFASLLKKRKLFKLESEMDHFIWRIEGVVYDGDYIGYVEPYISTSRVLYRYCQSLRASINSEVPLLTNINSISTKTDMCKQINGEIYQLVKLVLQDVTYFPEPKNIEDVIRLRNESTFEDFRSTLLDWASSLAEGDHREEKKSRSKLHQVCRHFKTLDYCGRVSKFSTYISIPVTALDLATGGIFGLAGTTIGIGTHVAAELTKKHYRALIIGM